MKKITVLVQAKDADDAISKLRALGVLHVEHQQAPVSAGISELQDDITLINQAMGVLSEVEFCKKSNPPTKEAGDWKFTVHHIIDMRKRVEQLEEYSRALTSGIKQWEAWGDFNPQDIKNLGEKNIHLRLYQIPLKEIKTLPKGIIVKKIAVAGGIANCLVVSQELIEIPFKEMTLPKMGLKKMRERFNEDRRVMEEINNEILKHGGYLETLLAIKKSKESELEFHQALSGMGHVGKIMYLIGYAPFDLVDSLQEISRREKWGMLVSDPSDEDRVPTLIRNPRWVSLIQPVFKLIEVIPGYRELDISPLFLIFLSLFFGMIIGDAGYGVLYFLATFLLQRKFSGKFKDARVFFLFYLFSACAVFWGMLSGTVFGQEWYLAAGFKPLIPGLNDTKFLQAFCFFLGAFHLTLAHGWQAARKAPSLAALADFGWVFVLWAAFFLARTLILNDPFPDFGKWLIIIGVSLVIFFTSPQKNIFKALGRGLGAVALSLVNNFTDVVSYVRLFAVGLAGVAIADTVNSLANGFGAATLPGVLIIFAGHTINMILGPMSVLVHGIRLNVLEFSSHAGLSWSGIAYQPLRE